MRERHILVGGLILVIRITPAYAGKTLKEEVKEVSEQDHPRVCGKDRSLVVARIWRSGSPPRMRERQIACCGEDMEVGITPAYAGKTHLR